MRQVPKYLIIGNGRLARHMFFYLQTLGCHVTQWCRSHNTLPELLLHFSTVTHIWILIRDDAISSFIDNHLTIRTLQCTLIHSAGSITLKNAYCAHPLQTFGSLLYPPENYTLIPFFIDDCSPAWNQLLPGLPNPHYRIQPQKKALYHALCVMANNFTTLLWQKFFRAMQESFGLSPEHAHPFLKQTLLNLSQDPAHALTGPIARQDIATLERNVNALDQDPYRMIFEAFIKVHCSCKTLTEK